jgi:flagellar motor switch protein FliN/FliY
VSTPDDRHEALLAAVAEGAHRALYERCDDGVQTVDVARLADDAAPLQELEYPAVCVTADRADGVAGGVCLCTTAAGARALAIRSLDPLPPEASEEPLQDSDLQSAGEWGAEVMASVSAAAAGALGAPLRLGEVSARALAAPDAAAGRDHDAPVLLRASLSVHGEPCLLLVSLPAQDGDAPAAPAPVAGVAGASADGPAPAPDAPGTAGGPVAAAFPDVSAAPEPAGDADDATVSGLAGIDLSGALSATRVRVWAELGHVRLPLRRAIDLPIGGVVELDCEADAPVDLYVNGLRFAQGQLVITADGEWALRVDDVCADVAAPW